MKRDHFKAFSNAYDGSVHDQYTWFCKLFGMKNMNMLQNIVKRRGWQRFIK